jgi:glycosyltransferase involved in cell wall biosynthesis
MEPRVTFTGTLPNAPLSQQLFDVAVLTSENEGFPNSLVEASACGIPLVATPVGGVPDVLVEGETGLGVAVGDVPGTRDAILALLRDAGLRARMGAHGRERVAARFSEEAAIARLLSIYNRVTR